MYVHMYVHICICNPQLRSSSRGDAQHAPRHPPSSPTASMYVRTYVRSKPIGLRLLPATPLCIDHEPVGSNSTLLGRFSLVGLFLVDAADTARPEAEEFHARGQWPSVTAFFNHGESLGCLPNVRKIQAEESSYLGIRALLYSM